MISELKFEESKVFTVYAIVSVTGPVFGVVSGGNVISCLGGYNSKKGLYLIMGIAVICVASGAPIAFVDDFASFGSLLWALLFFGGFMLPGLTGIMLNTVEPQFKTSANSMANLTYNLLGYLPAPIIYGLIYDAGEGGNARYAMAVLMFTPIISMVCILSAAYLLIKFDVLQYKKQEAETRRKK